MISRTSSPVIELTSRVLATLAQRHPDGFFERALTAKLDFPYRLHVRWGDGVEVVQEDPYRFLICADKFQTGYDEPLLHTMYVDKILKRIEAAAPKGADLKSWRY